METLIDTIENKLSDGRLERIETYEINENGNIHKKIRIRVYPDPLPNINKQFIDTYMEGDTKVDKYHILGEKESYYYVRTTVKRELKVVAERRKWKKFGDAIDTIIEPVIGEDIFINYSKFGKKMLEKKGLISEYDLNLFKNTTFKEEKKEEQVEEFVPSFNFIEIKERKEGDEYTPNIEIIKKHVIIIKELPATEENLYDYVKEIASENGIVSNINILPPKYFYDRKLNREVVYPRIAFIEYPHPADAFHSCEYINGLHYGNYVLSCELSNN
jgi:hypothetical protein